ncbi:MAG: DUF3604 domain-containing protein, partial [Phenylobacterium sp.]|nr:DUF3604 domain-containing protein [Phenylobacterium sp.]
MTKRGGWDVARYVAPAALVGLLVGGGAIGAQALQTGKPKPGEGAPSANAAGGMAAARTPGERLPGHNADRNAYFGDLHVHTSISNDAYIFNVRRTPDDAYRFGRGETIGHASG